VPQSGRLELQVLRDPEWLADRLERKPIKEIAAGLGCSRAILRYWIDKHGITSPRLARTAELETAIRRMHAHGDGPGTIAEALDSTVSTIRKLLERLGLATRKRGHVYHSREWWRTRLEDQGLTVYECARQAGIKKHVGFYYVKKFDLGHAVDRKRRRRRCYPELGDPKYLRALLERHRGCYAHAAAEVGCYPTLVSERAREVLRIPKRHSNALPHSTRGWWKKRIKQGRTTEELAREAGIKEKTARERCRLFGLLPKAYENNRGAEGMRTTRRKKLAS
jgi:AraC-like DNA-binding protein